MHQSPNVPLVDEGLELLDEDECWRLASAVPVGRVAVSIGALPAIFPVNFAMYGNAIIFRTSPGTKLAAAVREAVIAFEVDSYDAEHRTGWSVLMIGQAEQVCIDPVLTQPLLDAVLDPWAGGRRDHVVRIVPTFVSGRRIAGVAARACHPASVPA